MMPMFDVQGFILVGGASARMGKDKARLMFGQQTSVQLIAAAMKAITRSVATVGWPKQQLDDVENIPDLRANWGPLGGIEAALRHATASHCLIVACDFPFVSSKLFGILIERAHESDAVVPVQSDGHVQPLCSIYRTDACTIAAEAAIAADQHSPRALLERVNTTYVPFTDVATLKGSEYFFFNVNTPENYQKAQRIFEQLQNPPTSISGQR